MSVIRCALCCLCVLLVACGGGPEPTPVAGNRTPLTTMDAADAERIAGELLTELGVEPEQRTAALEALRDEMAAEGPAREIASTGLAGVAAYRYGGGGLIISGGGGEGLASFAGGSASKAFAIRGWSIGLKAGGGKTFGVMLILGLKQESEFAATYSVQAIEAAGGRTGGKATPTKGAHVVRMLGTRTGLSAGVDAGKYSVEWAEKKE